LTREIIWVHDYCCRRAQIDKCFGFDTAVEESQRALLAAKVEASSACNGVGLVRLMGRQSGYIAMQASMASGAAHFHFLLRLPLFPSHLPSLCCKGSMSFLSSSGFCQPCTIAMQAFMASGAAPRSVSHTFRGCRTCENIRRHGLRLQHACICFCLHAGTGPVAVQGKPTKGVHVHAAGVVDVCLIPEVEFSLEKLTEYVQCLLAKKGHTVRRTKTINDLILEAGCLQVVHVHGREPG
jgi:hypothetical protein